jgi:hypothetical protein
MTQSKRTPTQPATPQTRATPEDSGKAKDASYYYTHYLPEDPNVLLLFEGLMWFMYHGKDECQIGIHNRSHTLPGSLSSRHHELEVKIWERDKDCDSSTSPTCCKPFDRHGKPNPITIGDPRKITGIQIDVNRPLTDGTGKYQEGVWVYQKEGYDFPRPDPNHENDPSDWRWMIDFERQLYKKTVNLKPGDINPGIWINHATFFTLVKTTYDFELHPDRGNKIIELGNVPLMAGGNIYLHKDGNVTLTIRRAYPDDPDIIVLPWKERTRYQIDIKNECRNKYGERCKPKDYGNKGNDFYLYNDNFPRPSLSTPKYTLHRVGQRLSGPAIAIPRPDARHKVCFEKNAQEEIESNNEAPCGPVCAGLGGG